MASSGCCQAAGGIRSDTAICEVVLRRRFTVVGGRSDNEQLADFDVLPWVKGRRRVTPST